MNKITSVLTSWHDFQCTWSLDLRHCDDIVIGLMQMNNISTIYKKGDSIFTASQYLILNKSKWMMKLLLLWILEPHDCLGWFSHNMECVLNCSAFLQSNRITFLQPYFDTIMHVILDSYICIFLKLTVLFVDLPMSIFCCCCCRWRCCCVFDVSLMVFWRSQKRKARWKKNKNINLLESLFVPLNIFH